MWESIKDAIGNLAGLLTFLGGILGGILLAQHSAWLQRRNWQLQEALRAYSSAFVQFGGLWPLYQQYVAHAKDPESQSLIKEIHEGTDRFDQALNQCRMLERSRELCQQIDEILELVRVLHHKAMFFAATEMDPTTTLQAQSLITTNITNLMDRLDNLRKSVARCHFRSRSKR
jgi:hypothetical protein